MAFSGSASHLNTYSSEEEFNEKAYITFVEQSFERLFLPFNSKNIIVLSAWSEVEG
jgi:hypothetical protein